MILIPPKIHPDTPNSEKKVFDKLKNDKNPQTKNWIVYHSLNYPVSIKKAGKSSYMYFGESDFLILAKDIGIINIEVKGGSLSCKNGVWKISNKTETKILKKSPIKQAHDTKYDIQYYIKKKINKKFPQEYLVVFPDCSSVDIEDNIEYSKANILDVDNFYGNFSEKIFSITKNMKIGGDIFNLEKNDIIKLKSLLRPDFDSYVKKSTILKESNNEINKYTDDQIKVLEYLSNEPRILVTGSQGTGKTVMAEEVINNFGSNYEKILFINSGRLGNINTKLKFIDKFNNITFSTYNKFVRDINKFFNIPISTTTDFISSNNSLTTKAFNSLKNFKENKFIYDLVIIDEMQHCFFYDNFYLLIDKILKKGLIDGNYCFFGDFENQNIIGERVEKKTLSERDPKLNLLNYRGIHLWHNVRNSEDIALEAPIISGLIDQLPLPYITKSTSGKVEHIICDKKEEKGEKLVKILRGLKKDNIFGNDIVILSNYTLQNNKCILKNTDISEFYKICDLSNVKDEKYLINSIKNLSKNETIFFSTALAFQGLESKIIIYLDPLDMDYSNSDKAETSDASHLLLFNAMGRAKSILYVLWDRHYEKWYNERLKILGRLTPKI